MVQVSLDPISLLGFLKKAAIGLQGFVTSRPYLPRQIEFHVPVLSNQDHRQDYEVEFSRIPEPRIQLLAGRLEWDAVLYAHGHFVIRTRPGTFEGYGTGKACLSYIVEGYEAPGWKHLMRKMWKPKPRILSSASRN